MKKLRLIFGKNGGGKSLYSSQKENDSSYIVLNSTLKDWQFDHRKNNLISEYYKINNEFNNLIENIKFNLTSVYKSSFKNSFNEFELLKEFLATYHVLEEQTLKTIPKVNTYHDLNKTFSLYQFLKENSSLLNQVTANELELLILYIKLSDISLDNEKNTSNEIQEIDSEITSLMTKIDKLMKETSISKKDNLFDSLRKLSPDQILFLSKEINNGVEELINNVVQTIKDIIWSSNEVKEILNFIDQKEQKLAKAFIFNQNIVGVRDNGKILDLSLKNDNINIIGERIAQTLVAVSETAFIEKKTLILDDIFEELDINNQVILANKLFNSNFNNIEILIHNENTFNILSDIATRSGIVPDLCQIKMALLENTAKPSITHHMEFNLTFESLNSGILGVIKRNGNLTNEDFYKKTAHKKIILFTRLFARNLNHVGSLAEQKYIELDQSLSNADGCTYYQFSSTNIFHYNEKVDIDEFHNLFGQFELFKNNETLTTIEFLLRLKKLFVTETSFGVSFDKIKTFIDGMTFYLAWERDIIKLANINNIFEGPNEQRNIFLRRIAEHFNKLDEYHARNSHIHSLDYSLASLKE